jgi:guanidinopropionase
LANQPTCYGGRIDLETAELFKALFPSNASGKSCEHAALPGDSAEDVVLATRIRRGQVTEFLGRSVDAPENLFALEHGRSRRLNFFDQPPVAKRSAKMSPTPFFEPADSSVTPRYSEIATFMRAARAEIAAPLDIALVGVPLDLGATYRSGARHGPAGVREASRLIRQVNPTTKVNPYRICNIGDVGDAPTHPLSVERSVELIEAFYERIDQIGAIPISVGGDHTVPLPILRAIARRRPVGLVQIDSHSDTFDEFMGTKCNHATFVRRAIEEGLLEPRRIIQIGLRGTRYGDDDIEYATQVGIRTMTMDEYEMLGRSAVCDEIRRVVGDGPAYVTIDIDGLDPKEAPGTGVPEPGGISMRDIQVILRASSGLNIVGGDICEVVPSLDLSGITCINAANLMFELTCLAAVARTRASARS